MNTATLITGAGGAIGSAVSCSLAAEGEVLFLHYHRSRDSAERVKKQCEERGSEVHLFEADLSAAGGASSLAAQLPGEVGRIVYTSGSASYGLFQDIEETEMLELANLHLLNAMWLVHELLPAMISRKEGTIVIISSIWGERGAALETAYSAMKGGINTFVKALAKETAPSGIRVNAVAPGMVDSPMMQEFTEDEQRKLAEDVPAGRFAAPCEIAEAVRFLMEPSAAYVNGHILDVNGAW
ncbi:elongation factor P 5-aminopentanone reductase [Salibacterium halotolerans]|uniref:3-oxoacyl-[acyl-carrier protein] reductase n=1 Tax=Salibacterium halotolerans TaxID=1884432 RepID=A0A1I5Y5Z5_9BACI|nr:SDR family NAD(P)-dependent oxidoreductase [Salibacterium halotolerans]SFQ39603.1 3-oxoacyl-[acyl-carrier protein] reductase [Salibacterium halotolerans]